MALQVIGVATLAQPIRRWQYMDELYRLSPCSRDPPPPHRCTAANLSFLHFPKCGTSLEVSMRLHKGVNMLQHHSSLDVNVSDAALSLVVAMFRPPAERVAS